MNEKEYNGWTNYETWLTALWFDNDQGIQEMAQELARDAEDTYRAGEALKDNAYELAEMIVPGIVEGANFVTDLFNAALSEVNWYEIAEGYREEMELA